MYAKFPGRETVHIRSINSKNFPTSDIFFLEFEGIDIKFVLNIERNPTRGGREVF